MTDEKKTFKSPLEDVFDIEENTTESKFQGSRHEEEHLPAPVQNKEISNPVVDDYETEDKKIKQQLSSVYDYALDAFETQSEICQSVDPKFAARNAEVAAQYLKIALDSTSERIKNRDNKAKLKLTQVNGDLNNITNNVIVGDRNELLEMLQQQRQKAIESDKDK